MVMMRSMLLHTGHTGHTRLAAAVATALLCAGMAAAACIPERPGTAIERAADRLAGVEWSDELDGGSGITALAVARDGALYAAGWTTTALATGSSAGGRDAFVRRYGPDGEVIWTRQFGAEGDDNAEDLAIDDDGNVYVAARVSGPVGQIPGSGGRDAYVAAYDPQGVELWALQFGTPDVDWADSLALAEDGTVFVSGSTTGSFKGFTNGGVTDNFLAGVDSEGRLVSMVQFGSAEGMGATALAFSAGRLYLTGSTLGPLSARPTGDEHAGSADLYLRIYEPDGEVLRTWTFGSNNADTALDLVVASDGSVVMVGTTRATLPNPVVGIGTRVGGVLDAFAINLDAEGNIGWVSQFGTDEWDVASGMAQGTDGVLYVAGRTSGAFPTFSAGGEFDVFVSAFSADGQALWTHQMGSAAEDFAYAVVVGPGKSLFVAGSGGLVGGEGRGFGDERGWVIRMAVPPE
jgi:hypothetical protein